VEKKTVMNYKSFKIHRCIVVVEATYTASKGSICPWGFKHNKGEKYTLKR
jgi:hypothetical protein